MIDDYIWSKLLRRRGVQPFSSRSISDYFEHFMEMESLFEREFSDSFANVPKVLIRERILPNGDIVKEWGPFVYGYSITVDPEGEPQIREFGNIKPEFSRGKTHVSVEEKREPLVDIMITDDKVKVIAELPGVEKKDIKLHGTEDSLIVSVDTVQHKYYKKLEMPVRVDPKKATSSYTNGVLEVTIQKKEEEELEGESIKID